MPPSDLIPACALVLKRSHPVIPGQTAGVSPHHTFHSDRLGRSHVRYLLQSQCLDGSFAQHKLLHLAAGRQRIALHELEVTWDLLVADPTFTVVAQFLLRHLLSTFGYD